MHRMSSLFYLNFLVLAIFHQSGCDVAKIPLDLGPPIPLVKGDPGTVATPALVKRELGSKYMPIESNLKGYAGQGYYFTIGLGTPQQKLNVLIDTGSSNFAVAGYPVPGLPRFFNPANSSTYRPLGRSVYVPYTMGSWSGPLGSDVVTLDFMPPGKRKFRTDVTPISKSSQFFILGANWEGIVGLAFKPIARPADNPPTPFFDSLVAKTGVKDLFSTQLCGSSASILRRVQLASTGRLKEAIRNADASLRVKSHGNFIVGGVDTKLYTGPMLYTPLRKRWYYEVVITGLTIKGQQVMSDCKEYNFDKTIVDTGTTDIRVPKRVFASLAKLLLASIQGTEVAPFIDQTFFEGKKMICVLVGSVTLFDQFPMMVFDLRLDDHNVIRMSLSPQQYLRYVGYNSGMERDCFKYGVQQANLGTVLGSVFLEGYFAVFDRANSRIGFAQSTCNYYGATGPNSSVSGPITYQGSTMDCAFASPPRRNLLLIEVVSVVLGFLCLLIFIPIVVLLLRMGRGRPSGPASPAPYPPPSNTDRSSLLNR